VAIIFKYKRSGGTGKFPQQHTLAPRLGFLGLLVFLVGKGKKVNGIYEGTIVRTFQRGCSV